MDFQTFSRFPAYVLGAIKSTPSEAKYFMCPSNERIVAARIIGSTNHVDIPLHQPRIGVCIQQYWPPAHCQSPSSIVRSVALSKARTSSSVQRPAKREKSDFTRADSFIRRRRSSSLRRYARNICWRDSPSSIVYSRASRSIAGGISIVMLIFLTPFSFSHIIPQISA